MVGGLPPADGSRPGSVSDDNGTERDSAEEEARWRQEVTLATCQFALLIREAVQMVPLDEVSFVKVRIGIHTGSIVTGINGTVVPRFSVFGDSVNVAARMETTGKTNRVHVSGAFADLLNRAQRGAPEFTLQTRDPVEVKGKGRMQTFWLDVQDLDDFRLKRAATLAFIDKLLLNMTSEQFMLTSSGTIRLESALPLVQRAKSSADEAREARHVALDLEGAGSEETGGSAGNVTSTTATAAANTAANTTAPLGCGFSYADLVAADFNPLAIQETHFERICEAILVLFEGFVGSPGCASVTEPETLKRLVRRVGGVYRAVPYHSFW